MITMSDVATTTVLTTPEAQIQRQGFSIEEESALNVG